MKGWGGVSGGGCATVVLSTNAKDQVGDGVPGRCVRLLKRPIVCCDVGTFRSDPISRVIVIYDTSCVRCFERSVVRGCNFGGIGTVIRKNGRHCGSMCRKLGTTGNASCILVRSNTHPLISGRVVIHSVRAIRGRGTYMTKVPMGSAVGISSRLKCSTGAPSEGDL